MSSYLSTPAAAGPSRLCTVSGVWKKSVSTTTPSNAVEVIARVETPPPNFSLPARPPATYTTYQGSHDASNALDDFFGAGALEAHRPLSRATASSPPPYSPHGYDFAGKESGVNSVEEPPTLARMLFMYGFRESPSGYPPFSVDAYRWSTPVFFPFWLAGIYILCSPLLPTPDWEAGKTESEKTQELRLHRETEKKWARRCLCALFGLTITVFLLFIIIQFGIMGTI
jgi:hypothetical protein